MIMKRINKRLNDLNKRINIISLIVFNIKDERLKDTKAWAKPRAKDSIRIYYYKRYEVYFP